MSSSIITALGGLLALSFAAVGCMPQQTAPPPVASVATPPAASAPALHSGNGNAFDRHVYRLDFVLSTNDGSGAPATTSFTLHLGEFDKGEVHVGKNVALSPPPPSTGGPPGGPSMGGSARQDVGVKIAASFRTVAVGDDIFLEIVTEMSSFDPPTTIRKVVAKGNALAPAGKATLVTSLDDDHKHYQLTVTPTKVR